MAGDRSAAARKAWATRAKGKSKLGHKGPKKGLRDNATREEREKHQNLADRARKVGDLKRVLGLIRARKD